MNFQWCARYLGDMTPEQAVSTKEFFEYDHYRDLLAFLVAERKRKDLPCSFRWMAQQAGYTSPNFFKLVMDGDRELTPEGAEKVIRMFRLAIHEADYFRALVQFHRSKDLTDKLFYAEKLVKLKPKDEVFELQKSQFEYHRKWWYVVLREVLTLPEDFRSAADIHDKIRLNLSRVQIEEGLLQLEKLGLIQRDRDGVLEVAQQNLRTADRVVSSALFSFHLEILDLAKLALSRFKAHEREFHALTARLSPEAYEIIRRKIQTLKTEILELSEASESARKVYQLNLQLFPVAEIKDETRDS